MVKQFKNLRKLHKPFKLIYIVWLGIAVCCLLIYFQHPTSINSKSTSKKSSVANSHKSTQTIKPKVTSGTTATKPATQTPTPTTVASNTLKPITHNVPTRSTSITTPAKIEPVVTPSPSSSVTSLTPTSPSTPPASSSPSSSNPSSTPTTTTSYTSTNWSGYLATTGNYTSVSGSWQATSPTSSNASQSADATWIGIGGVTSSDLIQIGTQNTVSSSGQVNSSAFYEMLPEASIRILGVSVSPGDSISTNINEISSGQWSITITDTTDNQTYTKDVAYDSSNSSAEWIEEDPSYSSHRLVPFDNFGSADFISSAIISSGNSYNLNTGGAQPITMVGKQDQPIATPSSIGSDGASFSVSQN
jgi:hypothetical protein